MKDVMILFIILLLLLTLISTLGGSIRKTETFSDSFPIIPPPHYSVPSEMPKPPSDVASILSNSAKQLSNNLQNVVPFSTSSGMLNQAFMISDEMVQGEQLYKIEQENEATSQSVESEQLEKNENHNLYLDPDLTIEPFDNCEYAMF